MLENAKSGGSQAFVLTKWTEVLNQGQVQEAFRQKGLEKEEMNSILCFLGEAAINKAEQREVPGRPSHKHEDQRHVCGNSPAAKRWKFPAL